MRNFKKMILCLVALAMLIPTIASCSFGKGKGDETPSDSDVVDSQSETQKETETDEHGQIIIDNTALRDLDFNGKTIYFAIRESQYKREWFSEEPKTDFENKVYYRNVSVEEEINVKLNYNSVKGADADKCKNLNTLIKNVGESGQGGLDVVAHYAAFASNAALIPYYKNWYSDDLTYLNLDNPYWNQSFIDSAEAFGRLFLCVGDVNLSVYDRCHVVYFNKALADNLRIMDQTAFALCKENNMPIIVFDMNKENNLYNLMQGDKVGTVVSNQE